MDVIIREAKRQDCQTLLDLSMEIANYHSPFNGPQIHPEVLEHDAFDVENPNIGFYVAEINGKVIGYAHYSYAYNLRLGKFMYLQDLYVQETFRNQKIGDKLMKAVAQKAVEQKIEQIEFTVADWNRAKNFYKKIGAVDYTETDNFHWYLFEKAEIERMASS